jgi:hypothetical protein
MSEDKSPVEKAVELMVYAPVGFVNFMRTMLPGWIEQGRQEVTKQAATAKVMSEFAIGQARKDAEKAVIQAAEVVSNLQHRRSGAGSPPAPRPPAPASAPTAPVSTAATPSSAASPATAPSAGSSAASSPTASNNNGPRPNADALAIPGYDSLAASQVVQRLGGLSSAELEAVRKYEAATRGRRTILNKCGQLQAETGP